jgi:hypothetical protein
MGVGIHYFSTYCRNRGNSFSIGTRLRTGRLLIDSRQGQWWDLASPPRPNRLWGPPRRLPNWHGDSFLGDKEAGAWSWPLHLHLVPSLKMRGAIAPLPPYVLVAWYLIKRKENFTFTRYLSLPCPFPATQEQEFCILQYWTQPIWFSSFLFRLYIFSSSLASSTSCDPNFTFVCFFSSLPPYNRHITKLIGLYAWLFSFSLSLPLIRLLFVCLFVSLWLSFMTRHG